MSLDKFLKKVAPPYKDKGSLSQIDESEVAGSKKLSKTDLDRARLIDSMREGYNESVNADQSHLKGSLAQLDQLAGELTAQLKQLLTNTQWQNKLKENESQLAEKQNELEYLKTKRDQLESLRSKQKLELQNYKKKSRDVFMRTLKQMYRCKRQSADTRFTEFGHMTKDGLQGKFVEGEKFITNRKNQLKIQEAIALVQQQLSQNTLSPQTQQIYRQRFINLQQKRDDLKLQFKRLNEIKHQIASILRARLFERQCHFAKDNWPVLHNRYLTLQLLNSGDCHEVYRGFDLQQNTYKALKIYKFNTVSLNFLKKSSISTPDKHIVRSGILEQITHPNIIQIESVITEKQKAHTSIIVMQMMECVSLAHYLAKEQSLQQEQAKFIGLSILSALDCIGKKAVHTAIRPDKILVSDDGTVKLIGLEEAKILSQCGSISICNQPPEESEYHPPEYFRTSTSNTCQLTAKADVWAAGIIFFKMLFGTTPFHQHDGTWYRDFKKVDAGLFSSLGKNSSISEQAKNLIIEWLCFSEKHRKSARELLIHPYFSAKS